MTKPGVSILFLASVIAMDKPENKNVYGQVYC